MAMNFGGNWAMLGAGMGQGLGRGINESVERGLDLLQKKKLADLMTKHGVEDQEAQKKYLSKQLEPLYGVGTSEFLAGLPPKERYAFMSNAPMMNALMNKLGPQQSSLQQILQPELGPQVQPGQMPQQRDPQQSPNDILAQKLLQLQGMPMTPGQGFMPPMQEAQPQQPVQPPTKPMALQQQAVEQPDLASLTAQALSNVGKPMTEYQQRREARETEKEESRRQEKLSTFIKSEEDDYKRMRMVGHYAKKMRKIIEEHGHEFPGIFVGNLDENTLNKFLKNPYVREFMDMAKELAVAQEYAKSGNPTNMKLKLAMSKKPGVGKPIETNLNELDDIISQVENKKLANKYLLGLQDKKGNFPHNTPEKLNEYYNALDEPLKYPEFFPVGMHYVDDEGIESELKMTKQGKKWEETHG